MIPEKVESEPLNFDDKDFLTLADFNKEEIEYLVMLGLELKQKLKKGIPFKPLNGKILGMIFEKSSTRTRVSFEVAMLQLGGHALFLNKNDIQLGRGETITDTAKVLSGYLDGILMRTDDHNKLSELADNATIPIINGLSDLYHPTQAIADFMTIYEKKGKLKGTKLAYVGDGNNVTHSLMIGGAKLGIDIAIVTPKGYEPMDEVVKLAMVEAEKQDSKLVITNDIFEAVADADVIYTDVWTSMGQEAESELRLSKFQGFQVNREIVSNAKPSYIFMHCLPAHRGEEVTAEIIDGPNSVVFDEAENRLHAHKAILSTFLYR